MCTTSHPHTNWIGLRNAMTTPFKLIFIFSSFGPLYAVFALEIYLTKDAPQTLCYLFSTLFAVSIVAFITATRRMRQGTSNSYTVVDVKPKDAEVFPYTMTYILPLIFKDFEKPNVYIPLTLLYGLMCLLYIRLDALYINPFFLIFGYRIFEAKLEPSRNIITIIAYRRPVSSTERLQMRELSAGVYYC